MTISPNESPPSEICPRPPRPETRSMSSVSGVPPLESAPATCTELALRAAALAAARISLGDFDATPLPEDDEPPQPAIRAASPSRIASTAAGGSALGPGIERRSILLHPSGRGGWRVCARCGHRPGCPSADTCRGDSDGLLGSEPCPPLLLHTVVITEVISKPQCEQHKHSGCSYCF